MTTPTTNGGRKIVKTETVFEPKEFNPNEPKLNGDDPNGTYAIEDTEGLQQYLQQFGEESFKIKVYKTGQGAPQYCFSGGTEIDEDLLQSRCGGGDYELRVFVKGLREDTLHLRIADKSKDLSVTNANDSSLASIQASMYRDQISLLTNLLLSNTNNRQSTPLGEMAEMLKTLAGLNTPKDPMDSFLKGIEMAKSLQGSSSPDWKTELVASAKDIAKTIAPMMVQGPAMNPNPAGEQPMQTPTQDMMLKAGIAFLKKKALAGMNPDLAVEWIMSNADDATYQPFISLILGNDFETFLQLDPEIGQEPHLKFFRTLHSGLRDMYNENQHDDDINGHSGNLSDAGNHAGSGKKGKSK